MSLYTEQKKTIPRVRKSGGAGRGKDFMSSEREDGLFLDELYDKYASVMFRTALRFGVSEAAAEDIVSDGMLSLMKNVSTLRKLDGKKLSAYIVTAVRRAAINRISRDTLRRDREKRAALSSLYRADEATDPYDAGAGDELDKVVEIIERLPPRERACIKLKYLLDKSSAQIALETDLSPGSVRKYISRALKRIRKELEESGV